MYESLMHESQTEDLHVIRGSVPRELKNMIKKNPNYASSFRYHLIYFHFIVYVLSLSLSQLNTSIPLTSNWRLIEARDHILNGIFDSTNFVIPISNHPHPAFPVIF